MQKNIFGPLGITEISFAPSEQMKSKLAYMNQRAVDGTLSGRDHLLNRSLRLQSEDDAKALFHSGGSGLFAQPRGFASKIIQFAPCTLWFLIA
jgi:CubicO group peptidase (beta-lactamase class C family)